MRLAPRSDGKVTRSAPSQDLLVIRRNRQTGQVSLDPLRWALIPYWIEDPKGGRKQINAKCETVHKLPTFRDAYRWQHCIVRVDGAPVQYAPTRRGLSVGNLTHSFFLVDGGSPNSHIARPETKKGPEN